MGISWTQAQNQGGLGGQIGRVQEWSHYTLEPSVWGVSRVAAVPFLYRNRQYCECLSALGCPDPTQSTSLTPAWGARDCLPAFPDTARISPHCCPRAASLPWCSLGLRKAGDNAGIRTHVSVHLASFWLVQSFVCHLPALQFWTN